MPIMSLCNSVSTLGSFHLRYSTQGTVVKKMSILNKNIVHLIDDIFWNMPFKTDTQAEKVELVIYVILIISIVPIMCIILIILVVFLIY